MKRFCEYHQEYEDNKAKKIKKAVKRGVREYLEVFIRLANNNEKK